MRKMPATSWARINPRLSSSRTAAASKMVRWPTKASTRRLTVLKPLSCLAAVVLPIVTLTTGAMADDDKTYVGAECRSINPADPVALRPHDGAAVNTQLQRDQTWICPVVRDSVVEDPEFARITVIENGTDLVRCEFEARDHKGENSKKASPSKREQTVTQTVPMQLVVLYSWGGGEDNALSGVPDHGYYFFRCTVPGRTPEGSLSGVVTYKVSEN
jgi:hypothetical protein